MDAIGVNMLGIPDNNPNVTEKDAAQLLKYSGMFYNQFISGMSGFCRSLDWWVTWIQTAPQTTCTLCEPSIYGPSLQWDINDTATASSYQTPSFVTTRMHLILGWPKEGHSHGNAMRAIWCVFAVSLCTCLFATFMINSHNPLNRIASMKNARIFVKSIENYFCSSSPIMKLTRDCICDWMYSITPSLTTQDQASSKL